MRDKTEKDLLNDFIHARQELLNSADIDLKWYEQ